MELVKITDTKQWSSIDIFLFSNGQQYSPPRKYHLIAEELQWWGTITSYLGRTHYGSGHSSIELYTLDGTKINGPLELINGSAYVAVEPPDSFINTGYEEYLLKATRSREKREAQKIHNNEVVNSDLTYDKDATERNTADDINATHTAEKSPDSASFREMKNMITSLVKTRPNKPQQRLQRKSITTPKPIQKKKSFDTHSAALKRICAETDKVLPCPKRIFQQKKERTIKQPTATRKIYENQKQMPYCKTRGLIRPECDEGHRNHKNSIQSDKTYQLFPVNNDADININVEQEQPVIDFYNIKKSEVTSLKNNPELYSKNNNIEQNHAENDLIEGDIPTKDNHNNMNVNDSDYKSNEPNQGIVLLNTDILKSGVERVSSDKIPKETDYKYTKSHIDGVDMDLGPVSEKHISDEYVAHMNKGDILRLKLKVKLKDCKTIFYRDKSKNYAIAKSLSNLPENEKSSQVDININLSGELLKTTDEECTTPYKSLQSLLNKLYTEGNDDIKSKKSRIIILKCACRDYTDKLKCCKCENAYGECEVEETKYGSTFYIRKPNEIFTSCVCENESVRASKDENFDKNGIARQSAKDVYDNRSSICKSNGSRVKYLAKKIEDAEVTQNLRNKNGNYNNISWNATYGQPAQLIKLNTVPILEGYTKYNIEEANNNSRRTSDKSTQTDWCNILLEARRHEDDNNNYSFHLPSLYILKQCT